VLMQKLRGDAKRSTAEDEAVPTPAASH